MKLHTELIAYFCFCDTGEHDDILRRGATRVDEIVRMHLARQHAADLCAAQSDTVQKPPSRHTPFLALRGRVFFKRIPHGRIGNRRVDEKRSRAPDVLYLLAVALRDDRAHLSFALNATTLPKAHDHGCDNQLRSLLKYTQSVAKLTIRIRKLFHVPRCRIQRAHGENEILHLGTERARVAAHGRTDAPRHARKIFHTRKIAAHRAAKKRLQRRARAGFDPFLADANRLATHEKNDAMITLV